MTRNAKIGIAIALVVIVVALILLLRKKPQPQAQTNNGPISAPETTPTIVQNDNFPINVGSKGPNVKRLQQALNRLRPANGLLEDGDFGSKTRIAILMTLPTTEYRLPMDEATLIKIIAKANRV